MKKKVIVVTDGDSLAQKAVYRACRNLGLYPLLSSGGNPTPLNGPELVREIKKAPSQTVVVMLDDRGKRGKGKGEADLEYLLKEESIDVLGVVAVASATNATRGVEVDCAVDASGQRIDRPVDKDGKPEPIGNRYLEGDTAEILARYPHIRVVGCGDPGKMRGRDSPRYGAEITTRCIQELLNGRP